MTGSNTTLKSIFLIFCIFLPAKDILAISRDQLSAQELDHAHKKAQTNIHDFYLDLLFTRERRSFLKTQMLSLKRKFHLHNFSLTTFSGDRQSRQNKFAELVADTLNIIQVEGLQSSSAEKHIFDVFAESPTVMERQEVADWYNNRRLVFGRINADDWNGSLTDLVNRATSKAVLQYPTTESMSELAEQLAYILIEIHETYWRPKALRLLAYKIDSLTERYGFLSSFQYMQEHLADIFETHETLWLNYELSQSHQKQLAQYFLSDTAPPVSDQSQLSAINIVTLSFMTGMALVGICIGCFMPRQPENKPVQDSPSKKKKKPPCEYRQKLERAGVMVDSSAPCMTQQQITRGSSADQQFQERVKPQGSVGITHHNKPEPHKPEPQPVPQSSSWWSLYEPSNSWSVNTDSPSSWQSDHSSGSDNWSSSGPSNDEVYDREASF